jgi:hypothetical protein
MLFDDEDGAIAPGKSGAGEPLCRSGEELQVLNVHHRLSP